VRRWSSGRKTAAPSSTGGKRSFPGARRHRASGGSRSSSGRPGTIPRRAGNSTTASSRWTRAASFSGGTTKRHLVPFGEYIPSGRSLLPEQAYGGRGGLLDRDRPALFRVYGQPVAASICYEALFPELIRKGSSKGTWLVNVTNDAWFGDTVAPYQHLAMARMRCVEFRRPMVRAANSGSARSSTQTGGLRLPRPLPPGDPGRRGPAGDRGNRLRKNRGNLWDSCSILTILAFIFPLRGFHGIRNDGRENDGA